MRIVYLSYLHPLIAPGGAQQVALELFEQSVAQGHEAYLICAMDYVHEEAYGKPGAPIVPVPGQRRQYFFFPQHYDHLNLSVQDPRSLRFLGDLIERLAPDVVHFHHYHRFGVDAFRVARQAAPQSVITITFHEMMAICHADGQMLKTKTRAFCKEATPIGCNQCFPSLRPEFFILRASRLQALIDECDLYLFPSEFLAERYTVWGLDPRKCVVIPNGQRNLAHGFERQVHSNGVNRFAFFGQFLDNKGLDVILEAFIILGREDRVPHGGIVLEINAANKHFASDTFLLKVTKLLTDLTPFRDTIRIIDRDRYERGDLPDRMRSVDWVVVPSTWWEVFGLVVSEAWMFGRPVIVSNIGGLSERVDNDVNGFKFPARDARALSDLIEKLSGDRNTWIKITSQIQPPWTSEGMLSAHMEVWEEKRREAKML